MSPNDVKEYLEACGWNERYTGMSIKEGMREFEWFRNPSKKFFKGNEHNPLNRKYLKELREGVTEEEIEEKLSIIYEIKNEGKEAYIIRGWKPVPDGYQLILTPDCPNDGYLDKERFLNFDIKEQVRRYLRPEEMEDLLQKTKEKRKRMLNPW